MKRFRINPGAVCRQLLTNLKKHPPLTPREERELLRAIEGTGVPNGVDRLLASLSRNTINTLLENM